MILKKYKWIFFVIFGSLWIYFLGIKPSIDYDREIDQYLKKLDLVISGTVENIQVSTEHGFGMVSINISKTNIDSFDVRRKSDYYLCVIKNNKAEIVMHIPGT